MKLTTQQAAERLGKSRTAVWRAIKNGRLSADRTDAKDFLIDSAELERYASTLAAPMVTPNEAAQQTVTSAEPNRTMEDRIELATLRERTAQQEKRIADLEADREKWRGMAENATRLLTDQREQARRPWWRRLWGM
jgi:excisionase family DNA binding protein